MAGRSGGYNIILITVLVVLVAGLGIVLALQNGDLQQAKTDAANAEAEKATAQKNLSAVALQNAQLWKLLSGRDGAITKEAVAEYEDKLQEATKALAMTEGVAREFSNFHELAVAQGETLQSLANKLDSEKKEAATQRKNARVRQEGLDSANTEFKSSIDSKNREIEEQQQKVESAIAAASETNDEWRKKFEDLSDTTAGEIADLKAELSVSQNLLLRARDRIEVLEREKVKERTFAEVDPDGEVERVADEQGLAWINRGRHHRLRSGTRFEVFQYIKGGRKLHKGSVEVASVNDRYAMVRILHTADDLNPITAGDKITSPFYDAGEMPTFVIAGEELSSRYSLEDVRKQIVAFGGKVEDEVTTTTSYIVAIKGYEDSEAYKEARKLGITVMRESELYQFIGL